MEINKLKDVVFCNEKDSVVEVAQILRDTKQRHLIVVNDLKEPLGIISTVDINNRVVAEKKDFESISAADIMTKPIETIDIDLSYDEAYQKMVGKNIYSIPVTKDRKLVGSLEFNQIFLKAKEQLR
jgi:CBS domain-containing protein